MTDDRREHATTLLRETRSDPDPADASEFDTMLGADDPTLRRYGLDGLKILARRDPSVLTARVDRIAALLEDPDREVRAGASAIYAESLSGDPVLAAADVLVDLLSDSYPIVRWNALEALVEAARTDPAACEAYVEDVLAFLDADTDHVRAHAVRFLAVVSMERPEAVVPAADRLVEILLSAGDVDVGIDATVRRQAPDRGSRVDDMAERARERQRSERQAAGHAVFGIATVDPDVVRPAVDDLLALLADPDPQVRQVALDVLVPLAEDDPGAVDAHVEAIADCLDDVPMVRASASQALTAISPVASDSVASAALDHVEAIADLLDHDSPPVRASAASLLALAADRDPDAIADVRAELEALSEDDVSFVREAAADALADR
ncbi:HEAT repeats containing protein [Halorhabdus sp. SVX81]|uniref:HEAT repeat domain-containing protein n=1 Tax=Halorhabdus sp. SVX81 TaxID=2978283 RepID=UPI0023DA41AE|nr:HEAT repeat domain-containing protein [Halorhabdus sp. SVX81]WEL18584.1 HEAT repeats containing protein [Halorhabdus sp. SVX81]